MIPPNTLNLPMRMVRKTISTHTQQSDISGIVRDEADVFSQAPGMMRLALCVRQLQVIVTLYSGLVFLPKRVFPAVGLLEAGEICPRSSICSTGSTQLALLAGARLTAYWMLVPIGVVFLTKVRTGAAKWNKTPLSLVVPAFELHELHSTAGWEIAICSVAHTAFHVARCVIRGNLGRLVTQPVGWSGVVGLGCLVALVVPQIESLRKRWPFEVRKGAHVLAAILFAAVCLIHGPVALPIVSAASFALYAIDSLYAMFFIAHRVENSEFVRLGRGVELTFRNPPTWPEGEGYVNVLVPWISLSQWHPFSVYESFDRPGYSSIFALDVGDWTSALHASIARDTKRPVWIQGPFPSPYGERAVDFDNMILVATGIGVTPALSCIQAFGQSGRSLSLVWTCRDPSLIAFYARRCLHHTAVALIFYTGREPIKLVDLPSHVRVINARPNLFAVVPDVIRCVEHNTQLPSDLQAKATAFLIDMNSTYAGLYECSSGAARLRFDELVATCMRRGMTATALADHFLAYAEEDDLVSLHHDTPPTPPPLGLSPSLRSRYFGSRKSAAASSPPSIAPEPAARDVSLTLSYPPRVPASRVRSLPLRRPSRRRNFSESTGDTAVAEARHSEGDVFRRLSSGQTKVAAIDEYAFGRAFSALATNLVTLSLEDVREVLRSISKIGESRVTPQELQEVFEARERLNAELAAQQTAYGEESKLAPAAGNRSSFLGKLSVHLPKAKSANSLPVKSHPPLTRPGTEGCNKDSGSDQHNLERERPPPPPRADTEISLVSPIPGLDPDDPEAPSEPPDEENPDPPINDDNAAAAAVSSTRALRISNRRWGIMYCGGVAQVQETLEAISETLDIPLSVDKFNW